MESMGGLKRSHSCNDLGVDNVGEAVTLMGWVLRRRDHGGVIFIDLRDRWGITQVVFNPEIHADVHAKAHQLRSEWVIAVQGRVERRPPDMENPNLKTGAIEVLIDTLRILNSSLTPPKTCGSSTGILTCGALQWQQISLCGTGLPSLCEDTWMKRISWKLKPRS